MASMGMDLISRHGLAIDLVEEVLCLGNEEFKLNQRCIEAKPSRLIAYQNCKYCDEVDQRKTLFNRRKKAVVKDDQWTTARFRKDQEDGYWAAPQVERRWDRTEISDESPSVKALWAQWEFLHVENGFLKRSWESPDRRHVVMQLMLPVIKTKEVLQVVLILE